MRSGSGVGKSSALDRALSRTILSQVPRGRRRKSVVGRCRFSRATTMVVAATVATVYGTTITTTSAEGNGDNARDDSDKDATTTTNERKSRRRRWGYGDRDGGNEGQVTGNGSGNATTAPSWTALRDRLPSFRGRKDLWVGEVLLRSADDGGGAVAVGGGRG